MRAGSTRCETQVRCTAFSICKEQSFGAGQKNSIDTSFFHKMFLLNEYFYGQFLFQNVQVSKLKNVNWKKSFNFFLNTRFRSQQSLANFFFSAKNLFSSVFSWIFLGFGVFFFYIYAFEIAAENFKKKNFHRRKNCFLTRSTKCTFHFILDGFYSIWTQ